jgi:hypothetical protein
MEKHRVRGGIYLLLLLAAVCLAVLAALPFASNAAARDTAAAPSHVFLPVIYYPSTPAGTYFCLEYEFGLIWTSETITLYDDGSSLYEYDAPYGGTVSGTWSYDPARNEISLTGFRWQTVTYIFPNELYASEYLPHVDFEIAVYCQRDQ